MTAPANHPAGQAGVAAPAAPPMRRLWRPLLGALLLALTPGLASAGAAEADEWPTASDRGPRSPTRVPWLRFSGDPAAPVLATAPAQAVYAHEVVVVRPQELSRRQRRLLRRAERLAAKAATLRARAGNRAQSAYATVLVPVAPPAAPVVFERARPQVHVVRLADERAQEDEHDGCDESEAAEHEAERHEEAHEAHAPMMIDVDQLTADVERHVERALRDVERAHEQAERAHERAERARERAQRDAERAMQREAHRARR